MDKYDFERKDDFSAFRPKQLGVRCSITPMLPDDFKISDSFKAQLEQKYPITEITPDTFPQLLDYNRTPNIVEKVQNSGDKFVYTHYMEMCAELHIDPDILEKQTIELKRLLSRINDYEKKLQTGKYIELPCEIGDTVYWNNGIGYIHECRCSGFSISADGIRINIGIAQPFIDDESLFFSKKEAVDAANRAKDTLL